MIRCPAPVIVVGDAVLLSESAALVMAFTVAVDWFDATAAPPGSVPVAVAALLIDPLSRSAPLVTYAAVQVVDASGASRAAAQLIGPSWGVAGAASVSAMAMSPIVTLPVFTTVKV